MGVATPLHPPLVLTKLNYGYRVRRIPPAARFEQINRCIHDQFKGEDYVRRHLIVLLSDFYLICFDKLTLDHQLEICLI